MDFKALTSARFSARKYDQRPVSEADLDYILTCARLAPSAVNRQPWKFLIVESEAAKARLRQTYNREWFASAPLYIVCLADTSRCWTRSADGKTHGDIDVAIAAEHLCLAATERGLGTCWVCNFDPALLRQLFPTPGYEAVVILPLGHIAADCPQRPKERRPIEELVERM